MLPKYNQILIINSESTKSMGCPPSKQKQELREDSSTEMVFLCRQLSVQFRMEEAKLDGSVKSLTMQIKELTSKSPSDRERHKEEQILEQIVHKSHLKLIYKILSLQCQTIIERNTYLRHLESQALTNVQLQEKKVIMMPIQTIIFALGIIDNRNISKMSSDLQKFSELVKTRFPSVTPLQETKHQMINYYKNRARPSRDMIREFVLTFCQEENVALSVFNSSGHDFHY